MGFTSEQFQTICEKLDELLISYHENTVALKEITEMTREMTRSTKETIKESQEYRKKLDESNREEIFELIEIEIRRWYKKASRHTSPEKHEDFIKITNSHYREDNAFTDTEELTQKYLRLKDRNDYDEMSEEKYLKEHKLLVIFENVVEGVLQGYIVQFLMFLITGRSHGRYEGYWDKNTENELSVNDIEDIGKNHGEELEVKNPLIINDIDNSITNTSCFFSPSNEPEKNEVLISDLPNQKFQ